MKITKEIKVAVLVILSIVLFYWGFVFLKGKNLFDTSAKLYAVYDNVAGLVVSAPVTINGFNIGKVNAIEILPDGKMKVELIISNEEIQIAKSSEAQIMDSGLIGGREIAIINNFSDTNYAQSGDQLKTSNKLGLTAELANQIGPVKEKVEDIVKELNQVPLDFMDGLTTSGETAKKSAIDIGQVFDGVYTSNKNKLVVNSYKI